jgi:hypothetical protein
MPANIAAPPPPLMPAMQLQKSAPILRAPDPRDALLESIRNGKTLKKVDMEERPAIAPTNDKPNADSLAKSLNEFLNARKNKIRDSSESEEENSDEWDDD